VWYNVFAQLLGVINNWLGMSFPADTRWLDVTQPPIGGPLSFLPLAFYCVLLANVWLGWPFMTVVATGALQSIPEELYEAASIDGASGWQKLLYIIFRDKVISDKVGFTYSGSEGLAAAQDFVRRILDIREQLERSRTSGPHLVSVILDGENAWEHYPNPASLTWPIPPTSRSARRRH